MKQKGLSQRQEAPRVLRLHPPFVPPEAERGGERKEQQAFLELYCDVRSLRNEKAAEALRVREQQVHIREQHFQKVSAIIEKTMPVWRSWAAGEFDLETAQKKSRDICPDKATQTEVLEFLWPALEERWDMTAEEREAKEQKLAEQERELAAETAALAKDEELLVAAEQARLALEVVSSQVHAGKVQAIENAASIAELAIALLTEAEKLHPAATRKVAALRMRWPLLGRREPGWARSAAERMESLEMGRELECLRTRFREARGADENYPARQWAKAAVRTLEETRRRWMIYADYREEFKELIFKRQIDPPETPGWISGALRLPAFSSAAARQWGKVVREMIREQIPDFHTAPEWKNQRNTAKQNCRDSRGGIQNAILDDIVSALSRIAPSGNLPKPEC